MIKNIITTIKVNKIKMLALTLTLSSAVAIFSYKNIQANELKIENVKREYSESIIADQSEEAIAKNLLAVNQAMEKIQDMKSNKHAIIFLDELETNKNNYEENLLKIKIQKEEQDKLEKERMEKEKAEQERIQRENEEKAAKEKAEQERIAKEKAEQERVAKESKAKNAPAPKKEEKAAAVNSSANKSNGNANKSESNANGLTVDRQRGVYSDGYKTSKVDSGLFYIDCDRMGIRKFWVLEGKGDEQAQLKVAASLFTGSDRPSSNKSSSTNLVVGAHRTWGNGWHPFYNINKLQKGDKIYMHLNGVKFTFEVFDQYVVHESSASKVARDFGYYVLTLFSCEGGKGTEYRRVVHAKLVE